MKNMNIVEQFTLNQDCSIYILVPHFIHKINYFYKPTNKLHRFDEVTIELDTLGKNIILTKDSIDMLIESLKIKLQKILENKISSIPQGIPLAGLGRYFNEHEYKVWSTNDIDSRDAFDYSPFWLWSIQGVQTWIYTYQNVVYIEISPSYPSIYSSIDIPDDHKFEIYMHDYKPFLVHPISTTTALEWINQCNKVLQKIGLDDR